jgi:hypothetical protein
MRRYLHLSLLLFINKTLVLAVQVGDTEDKVELELGKSLGYVTLPKNTKINEYNRGSVKFKDDKVVSYQLISEAEYIKNKEADEKVRLEVEAKKLAEKTANEKTANEERAKLYKTNNKHYFSQSEFSGDDKAAVSGFKYLMITPPAPRESYSSLNSIGGSFGGGGGGGSYVPDPIGAVLYFTVKNTSNEVLVIKDITLTRNYPAGEDSKTRSCIDSPVSLSPNVEQVFSLKIALGDAQDIARFRSIESVNILLYNSESSKPFATSTWKK